MTIYHDVYSTESYDNVQISCELVYEMWKFKNQCIMYDHDDEIMIVNSSDWNVHNMSLMRKTP